MTDLVARSQRMPQAAAGWSVQYVVFAREGFSEAMRTTATGMGARLVSLPDLERTLVAARVSSRSALIKRLNAG